MNRQDITYALLGIILGLVFGFIVANMMWTGPVATGQRARDTAPQASVNSSSGGNELPEGHPPVVPGQTVPAPPLAGGGTTGGAQQAATPTDSSEMPSLEPLPASSREKRAEQQYKNIKQLRGVSADGLTPIMNSFKFALGVDCTFCHIQGEEEKDTPMKIKAREHIVLTRENNKRLGGGAKMTCYTCHRGQSRPPG